MSKEKPSLSSEESLRLIEQMIGRARATEKDSGRGWIIWCRDILRSLNLVKQIQ